MERHNYFLPLKFPCIFEILYFMYSMNFKSCPENNILNVTLLFIAQKRKNFYTILTNIFVIFTQ